MILSSWFLLGVILPILAVDPFKPHKPQYSFYNYYVLEHDPSSQASLSDTAEALGVEVVQQVGQLRDHWLVRTPKSKNEVDDAVVETHRSLQSRAVSSYHLASRSPEALRARRIAGSIRALLPQELRQRTKRDGYLTERAPPPVRPTKEINSTSPAHVLAARLGIHDPKFPEQWHFVNEEFPQHMMNVTPVWEELKITGKGVYVAMVDDGVDYTHEDIKDNFFEKGSYDFNDHQALPTPKLFDDHHGTRCAGEISAVWNDVCGVGIAYDSKIAGLRILSGPISDVDEAAALNYAYQDTAIYSCSWGPPDDGRSMEAPGYLIQKAILEGIHKGRGGKGSIFVFASGNGAASGDQCNFDGYTNSIFSVTVASVDHKGLHPYYSEGCAANMIVTYSSGSGKNIVTTDVGKGKCTSSHGGTSAAAPIASAVFALALEARPDLTWRDIQHLCIRAAVEINPDDPDWEKTAVGRPYSYKYGYGKLDAYQYVKAAQSWELVKPQAWVDLPIVELGGGKLEKNNTMIGGETITKAGIKSTITIRQESLDENNFEKLEHITVRIWVNHTRRGDVEVQITSPNNITSILAGVRTHDASTQGFNGWVFSSIKHWDENPIGDWTIKVSDQGSNNHGKFLGWTMSLFGSTVDAKAAVPYTLSVVNSSPGNPLPPSPPTKPGTKVHPKPTAHLPPGHGDAEGEADKPTFNKTPAEDTVESSTPDEGYFTGMTRLLKNSTWMVGAIGAVVIFGIGATIFFWRRGKRIRATEDYERLAAGEDVPMMNATGRTSTRWNPQRGTKELYDAFGEVSDDEADEEIGLRRPMESAAGLQFHSEFLADDDPPSATHPYKDHPGSDDQQEKTGGHTSPGSNDDSSWEHASQQARNE